MINLDLFDNNFVFLLLGGIVAILGLSLAIYGISTWFKRRGKVTERLDRFVAPETISSSDVTGRPIVPPEIEGSLFSRTIASWFRKFLQLIGRLTPKSMVLNLEHKLTVAGRPANLTAGSFFAIRLLVLLGGVFLAYQLNRDVDAIDLTSLLLGLLSILSGWMLPVAWLNARMRARQDEILRGLPDALDMLSVCASAGLGFDQSLQKISEYWDTELGHELKRVIEEMEMGVSRADALKNLSSRLDVDDLSRFVAILVQAERIGMSYADVLHSQALQMRVLRQLRTREIANKLPAKMILPLVLFIFPAMIAVILGPSIPVLMNIF